MKLAGYNSTLFILLFAQTWFSANGIDRTLGRGDKSKERKKNSIKLVKVPPEIHRRAAQLLEDVRDTDSAPGWENAVLVDNVRTLARPDVLDGPAYYEFRVTVDDNPAGFIVATAGDFDYPITHWNFEGLSPTQRLDLMDNKIKTYYKLDSLSYAGEDARGELVANIGSLPPDIEGLTMLTSVRVLENPEKGVEETFQNNAVTDDDIDTIAYEENDTTAVNEDDEEDARQQANDINKAMGKGKSKGEGKGKGKGKGREWSFSEESESDDSHLGQEWKNHKLNYHSKYEVLIESLKNDAAKDWEIDALADAYGEGLVPGEPHNMALLFPLASFEVSNEGKDFVTVKTIETAPGNEVLLLEAIDSDKEGTWEVDVSLVYKNGFTETKKFAIVPKKANEEEEEVEDNGSSERKLSTGHWVDDARKLWSSWSYWWAGTERDQRLYDQIPKGQSPNTSKCLSGCGATSWGMLFGWADFKASQPGSGWNHRWGLYRQDGGYGFDAVAPEDMNEGVRNMIWEIRNYIGTWCWRGSGATFPWRMQDATKYLSRRSGVGWTIHWNSFGISTDSLRDKAIDIIKNKNTPVIIGTGWLQHYPLAYGYRSRYRKVRKCFAWWCWTKMEYEREFYVNQGWGGSRNGWISASTWFAGTIIP